MAQVWLCKTKNTKRKRRSSSLFDLEYGEECVRGEQGVGTYKMKWVVYFFLAGCFPGVFCSVWRLMGL